MYRRAGVIVVGTLVALWSGPVGADFTEVGATVDVDIGGAKDGGVVFADFNADGYLDALVNRVGGSRLLFSDGAASPTFSDVTSTHAAGLLADTAERSAIAADLDNDGLPDLARSHHDLVEIYLNRGPASVPPYSFGDTDQSPNFRITRTDDDTLNPEGLGFVDVDLDGFLDIAGDNDGEIRFYLNSGDGTFTAAMPGSFGLPMHDPMAALRDGDYVAVTDFDLDGLVDIAGRNQVFPDLYRNVSTPGAGMFESIAMPDLDSTNDNKGGTVFCDFDGDGDFDFYYSDGEGPGINEVYVQSAPGVFTSVGTPGASATNVDGVDCDDVDNDGDVDLFLARDDLDQLFLNQLIETGTFGWSQNNLGIAGDRDSEGAVFVDYDRDGDVDLFVNQTGPDVVDPMTMMTSRTGAPSRFWQNDQNDTSYLMVRILAEVRGCPTPVVRDDIGATMTLTDGDGWIGLREVNGGMGHGTQKPSFVHFGLPPAGPDATYELTVRFHHGDEPDAVLSVTPSQLGTYQLLEVVATDPDGDTIPTAREMADAAGDPDPDGDGVPAWLDDDSDGDGTSDRVEAGGDTPCGDPADANDNGVVDYLESGEDRDGDTVVDSADRDPDDPMICADTDGDTCDDCSVAGRPETDNDGRDTDGDGICDAGEAPDASVPTDGGVPADQTEIHGSGCVRCALGRGDPAGATPLLLGLVSFLARRRRG